MSRDWDVVVVGLGALGLGGRLLGLAPAGRPRAGPRAVRDRPPQRRVRGREPDRPALLPPSRLRAARPRGPTRPGREVERESGLQVVFRTGGLDVGPRETADGVAIDLGDYVAGDGRRGRAVRDARRPTRSCAAGRRGGWTTSTSGCSRRTPASRTRPRATPPTGGSRRRRAPSSGTHAPVARIEGGDGEVDPGLEDGEAITRRQGRPRHGRVDERPARRRSAPDLPLTVTQEQVELVHAPRRPAAVRHRTGSRSGSGWTSPRSTASRRTATRGPKVGQDVGGRQVTPATRTFDRDDDGAGPGHDLPRGPPAGHGGRAVPVPRPACTR